MQREVQCRRNKLISLLIIMVLICGILPIQAIAAEVETDFLGSNAGCYVSYDLDDGTYAEYHSETVPVGGLITDVPAAPERSGYLFLGWAHAFDNGTPVFWDFKTDKVENNMTLWAAWEKGCHVSYDLDDGTYAEYHSETVPVGGLITDVPAAPERNGYLFLGWAHAFDNETPIFWDFKTDKVENNMTLWAVWEKGCHVFYDLDDGTYTEYHSETVPVGGLITDVPVAPKRSGYLFLGWAYALDNETPVFWDFKTDKVENNMTLWAVWEKKSEGGGGGTTDPGTTDPGTTDPGTTNPGTTNPGTTDPGTTDPGVTDPGTTTPGITDPGSEKETTIDDDSVPTGSVPAGSGTSGGGALDNAPKTGDTSLPAMFYGVLALMSLLSLGLCLPKRKKTL